MGLRGKSLLPFGNGYAISLASGTELAATLRRFNRPVAEVSFTGQSHRAAVSGVVIGHLAATAVAADSVHVTCMVDPQVAIILPISGSGRIIRQGRSQEWAAGKAIVTNSYDQPLELTTDSTSAVIVLRPSTEKLLAALRSALIDRNGKHGAEAETIMARLLVRGPFIDQGRSWPVDYYAAIMKVVTMFDDCHDDGVVLARLGIEDVLNRLIANLILEQEQSSSNGEATQGHARSTKAVDVICDHIRKNIGNPMSISEMEQLTGLTGRALNYAFRSRFDCSPQEWQRNFLLDHAKEQLKDPEYMGSVKSIAYELGFSSPSSFAAFYRQRFGERPSETLSGGPRRPASLYAEASPQAEE